MSAPGVAGTFVAIGIAWWIGYGLAMVLLWAVAGLVLFAAIGVIGTITYLGRIWSVRDARHARMLFFTPAILAGGSLAFHYWGSIGGPHFGRWLSTTADFQTATYWWIGILLGLLSIVAGLFALFGWLAPLQAAYDGGEGGELSETSVYALAVAWAFVAGSSWMGFVVYSPWLDA